MTRLRAVGILAFSCWMCSALPVEAQESQFVSDLRREGEQVVEDCDSFNLKALGGCAYTLITSYPLHVSLGSLAPGNDLAIGVAVAERYTPNESWRITWSGDAVRTPSGSYRAGAYMKFIHTPTDVGVVVRRPDDPPVRPRSVKLDTWVMDLFGQRSSLETIDYFGQGQGTTRNGRSTFGETQLMLGGAIILPMSGASWIGALRPAFLGGVTVRAIDIRPGQSDEIPSIDALYGDESAPGLARQDTFVEFREGVRFRPSFPNGRLQFNYLVTAQQFRTSTESQSSFSRWTIDLQHRIPLYRAPSSSGSPREFNGPNECAASVDSLECPPIQRSRDRSGTIGFRVLFAGSGTHGLNRVPFYLQPTLGGSDVNGERLLASFDDYRFRGPQLLAMQESLEHSIWGPIGVFVMLEQGHVGIERQDLGLESLIKSTTVGLTVRAGGFPLLNLSFSWGGEGHHVIGTMDTSLLGGGSRPSLF